MADPNVRVIAGNVRYRRFAYRHKRDRDRFGLLLAANYKDARTHLGSGFDIRQTWLSKEEEVHQAFDYDLRLEIVASVLND